MSVAAATIEVRGIRTPLCISGPRAEGSVLVAPALPHFYGPEVDEILSCAGVGVVEARRHWSGSGSDRCSAIAEW